MRARLAEASDRRVAVEVEGPRGRQVLELSGDEPVWEHPPVNLDLAAVALVQYAASLRCDLALEGPVTRDLLDNLDEYLAIWRGWRPDLFEHVTITAEQEVDPAPRAGRLGAVTGFSGGVDSSFALAAHQTGALGRQSRHIDLGVLVVDRSLREGGDEALQRVSDAARRALAAYGVELAVVRSNWQEGFCNAWFMAFNTGYMSVLHTFAASHSAAIHAVDQSYLDEMQMPPFGSKMQINHLLGHPGFPVVSTGGTHHRVERVAFLSRHPDLLTGLRVCYERGNAGVNCGHCEKCVRTQLELRAVGVAPGPAFPSPFTAADIRRTRVRMPHRLAYFERVLERLDPEDEMYPVLDAWLRDRRAEVQPDMVRSKKEVARLRRRLAEAEAEVAALRSSTSWRITRPLRAAADLVRRRG